MDVDDVFPVNGLEAGHQNGIHEQLSAAGGEDVLEKVNGNVDLSTESAAMNGNAENVDMLDDNGIINAEEVGEASHIHSRVNGLTISEDLGVRDADQSKHSKPQKGQGKSSKEKSLSPKHAGTTSVKKKKDGKDDIATSASTNGSLASNSRPKQTLKSRSFNDKQVHLSKQSKNYEAASATSNVIQPEGLAENTRPRPVKPGNPTVSDANTKSTSPTEGDAKSRKVGALPAYNFSFRCDERAEKRREFYSKLEEKTHAKELERTNLQAKSKETQEAEIKMLRKSLNFKATPMPSFYQEPPPPKVELKKIPPTRAKSPKLGRKKSSAPESDGGSSKPGRLSLDEKASQDNPAKGISPGHPKKPLRKSLPKLPSERTKLSKSTNEAAFLSQEQEPVQVPDPSKTQPDTDDKSEVEEQAQQTEIQEPIELEEH